MTTPSIPELLAEYTTALDYTRSLVVDLTEEEVHWRPVPKSSAIGWHLGHQAAVGHFMVRNLTAAEPSPDGELDGIMDGATEETQRGNLPPVARIDAYRSAVAERVRFWVHRIDSGDVGAPEQLRRIAENMMIAIINHEYQHSKWIAEIRNEQFGHDLPELPTSGHLVLVDDYLMTGVRPLND